MPEAAPREPRSFVCVQDPGLWPVTGLRPVCIDILRSITVLSEILRSILRGGCEREREKNRLSRNGIRLVVPKQQESHKPSLF